MKRIIFTCDICEKELQLGEHDALAKVKFLDGESPHSGAIDYKTADVCVACLLKLDHLMSCVEFDDVKAKLGPKTS